MLEIFLVVSLSFIFSVNLNSVNSYAQSAEENRVCCQQARIDSELSYCQYTDSGNCEGNSGFPSVCESTSFCRPVCCDLNSEGFDETGGLGCYRNVPAEVCRSQGGNIIDDSTCGGAPQCQTGCCLIGTQGLLTTEAMCQDITSQYESLEMNYRTDVMTELECFNLARAQSKGCCVVSGGENACTLDTLAECQGSGGEFFEGIDCINVPNNQCEQCNYPASVSRSEWDTGCNADIGDNVYYYDKCDNPIVFSQPADTCEYVNGFICRENEESGDASCESLNCGSETIWDNPRVDENRNCASGAGVNDDCWKNDAVDRVNGESWCEFDADAGPTRDLPGTRHYVHACIEGEEQVFECEDYREEYCFQFDTEVQSFAKCLPNRAIEEPCGSCEDRECCGNSDLRDCVWLSASQEDADNYAQDVEDRRRQREGDPTIEVSVDVNEDTDGVCIPLVPPGTKDIPEMCGFRNQDEEFKSELEIEVAWHTAGFGTDWDCDGPCEAYTQKFAYQQNTLCKSMGDCGADYNLAGVWSKDGFSRECDVSSDISNNYEGGEIHGGDSVSDYGEENYDDDEADDLVENCLEQLPDPADKTDGEISFNKLIQYSNSLRAEISLDDIEEWDKSGYWQAFGVSLGVLGLASISIAAFSSFAAFFGVGKLVAFTGWAGPVGWIAAGIILVVFIIALGTSDTSTEEVTLTCNPWSPPSGSEYCNLCHEADQIEYKTQSGGVEPLDVDFTAGGLHDCTEYLCWSLGEGCEFEPETSEGPKCLSSCDNRNNGRPDVNFNVNQITPLDLSTDNIGKCTVGEDFSSQEKNCAPEPVNNGYNIKFVKANADVVIGIKTTELATCRWDWQRSTAATPREAYDSLAESFDQTAAATEHKVTLEANIDMLPEDRKTMYVACLDTCDNTNYPAFYAINIDVGREQDIGAPRFDSIDPPSNSPVANELENDEFEIKLKLGEPSYCRWSRTNDYYESMPEDNEFNCRNANARDGCGIKLSGLQEGANTFFIRCIDGEGNANVDAIPSNEGYTLFRSSALNITEIKCVHDLGEECGEIYDDSFTLRTVTFGGGYNGRATCYLKDVGDVEFRFLNTNMSSVSEQIVGPKLSGSYTSRIRCIDDVGNEAEKEFQYTLIVDEDAPTILKISYESGNVVVLTDEAATCKYSNDDSIIFNEMTVFSSTGDVRHSTAVDADYVHVKCMDRFNHVISFDVYTAEI